VPPVGGAVGELEDSDAPPVVPVPPLLVPYGLVAEPAPGDAVDDDEEDELPVVELPLAPVPVPLVRSELVPLGDVLPEVPMSEAPLPELLPPDDVDEGALAVCDAPDGPDVESVVAQAPSTSATAASVGIASDLICIERSPSVEPRFGEGRARAPGPRRAQRGGVPVEPVLDPVLLPVDPVLPLEAPEFGELAVPPVVESPALPVEPAVLPAPLAPELPIVPLPASVVAPVPGASAVLTPEPLLEPLWLPAPPPFLLPPQAPSAHAAATIATIASFWVRICHLLVNPGARGRRAAGAWEVACSAAGPRGDRRRRPGMR
jgi:hypothetical protein